MSTIGAAPRAAISSARAEASRRNGAKSRGPNTARALPALVRYRGAAQAEFLRSLRTLQALQAQAAKPAPATGPATVLAFGPERRRAGAAPDPRAGKDVPPGAPNEPERRGDVGRSAPAPAGKPDQETSAATGAGSSARKAPGGATPPAPRRLEPNEPDGAASRDLRPASRAASARTQHVGSIA